MSKKVKKSFKISWIHLQAVIVLILYFLFSKAILVSSSALNNLLIAFGGPFLYGTAAGCVFLYLFSHEDFFPLAREIEREEKKQEQRWQKRLTGHGKVFICLAVGTVAGPILGALTIRFLIYKYKLWYKYAIIIVSEIISTTINVGLIRGVIHYAGIA